MKERRLLLVEDNPVDEALILRALEKDEVCDRIVVVRDGERALEYLLGGESESSRKCRDMPCAVLLDLKLPRINGLEVLRRLRAMERTRLVPVVILTSSKEEKDMIEGYSLGANSYVQKPVEFDEFAEAVQRLGHYWLKVNEPPPCV